MAKHNMIHPKEGLLVVNMKIAHCCKVCNHVYYKAEALNGEPVKIDCSLRGTHKEIKDCSY